MIAEPKLSKSNSQLQSSYLLLSGKVCGPNRFGDNRKKSYFAAAQIEKYFYYYAGKALITDKIRVRVR